MRHFKYGILAVLLMLAWLAVVPASFYLGWFSRPLAERDDIEGFIRAAKQYTTERNPPVVAFAFIKNGRLFADHFSSSKGANLNADTLFPLASMSKWFTAYGVMALSDRGQLDLDRPVEEYLTRWHLPPSAFNNNKVTARLLLSHRAGLHDGLGFGDYLPTESLPSLEESLTNPRASSAKPARIAVTSDPGTEFSYSGGSYHLLELVVEEITHRSFEQYMEESVFKPLGMTRSNYNFIGGQENSVRSYTVAGELAPQYQYASSGATALNSSIHDIARYLQAQIPSSQVKGVVGSNTIAAMIRPQTTSLGIDLWGTGAILSAKTKKGTHIYGHDGANDPAINSSAKINLDNGDAIVVLVNGNPGFATALTSQWAYWQTGHPDWESLLPMYMRILTLVVCGWAAILLFSIVAFITRRHRASQRLKYQR